MADICYACYKNTRTTQNPFLLFGRGVFMRVIYMWQNKLYPDRVYIGQDEETKILKRYKSEIQAGIKQRSILRAMKRTGIDNFELYILYTAKFKDEILDEKEKYYFNEYENNGYFLYNDSYNFHSNTKETREKASKSLKNTKNSFYNITKSKNKFFGCVCFNKKIFKTDCYYDDYIDAAIAVDKINLRLNGPNNRINFPELFINTKIGDDHG